MDNRYKVWLEINKKALSHNIKTFRQFLAPKTELWSVVKSNAYGHGLSLFSKLVENPLSASGGDGVDGFCVDSVVEGLKLRKEGIKKPILVLGPTLSSSYPIAEKHNITISISSFDGLKNLIKTKNKPNFHLKIDTGMHRQGFYPEEISKITQYLKPNIQNLKGIYSHFASAKDINYPSFNDLQLNNLQIVIKDLENAGFKNLKKHISATAGTLINPKYHLDMVRVGIGLYGLWPSKELEIQLKDKIKLK
ncbi:MAG: alanine racemase, partial [Patescibacteria group bacterium]